MVVAILLCLGAFYLAAFSYEGGVMAYTSIGTAALLALQGKNILDSRPRPPIRAQNLGAQTEAGGGPVAPYPED